MIKQTIDQALEHIESYDMAASNIGQAIAVQNMHMTLADFKRNMKPVAWRVSFHPGAWTLYEYDPTGLPAIREIRPLYE
jgi:hypothetical protein